jgi:hypothetical protein
VCAPATAGWFSSSTRSTATCESGRRNEPGKLACKISRGGRAEGADGLVSPGRQWVTVSGEPLLSRRERVALALKFPS